MIRKFLDVSSGHLSEETWTWLNEQLASDKLHDPHNSTAAQIAGGPTALRLVRHRIRGHASRLPGRSAYGAEGCAGARSGIRALRLRRRSPAGPTDTPPRLPRLDRCGRLSPPFLHVPSTCQHGARALRRSSTMFDSPRLFRRSDPDFPITPAVQRRLIEAGRVEGEGPRAPAPPAGQRCRLCGCNIDRDPEADRSIPACGSCKARPDAHAASKPHAARTFTEADQSLIRKIHGYMPRMQLLGILNDRLRADIGSDAAAYTIEQLHAEIAALPGVQGRAAITGGPACASCSPRPSTQARSTGSTSRSSTTSPSCSRFPRNT